MIRDYMHSLVYAMKGDADEQSCGACHTLILAKLSVINSYPFSEVGQ